MEAICGGVGEVAQICVLYPLETIKVSQPLSLAPVEAASMDIVCSMFQQLAYICQLCSCDLFKQ